MDDWDYKATKFLEKHAGDVLKFGAIAGASICAVIGFAGAGLGGLILGGLLGAAIGAIDGMLLFSIGGALIAAVPHLIGCAVIIGILMLIGALWGVGAP